MSSALEERWEDLTNRMLADVEEALLRPRAKTIKISDLKSIPVAARLIGLHVKSLYRIVELGKVPVYGSRGRLRVCLSDLMPKVEPRRRSLNKLKNATASGVAKEGIQPET